MKLRFVTVAQLICALSFPTRSAVADLLPPEPPGMTPEQREQWVREQQEEKARWYGEEMAKRPKVACSRLTTDAGAGIFLFVLFGAGLALGVRRNQRVPLILQKPEE